jgi:RNA polymerase sigma-70 factor (ECF subfamily)
VSTIDDAGLVTLAQHGDLPALATLFERHRAGLYAAAISMLHDRHEAADAVQDVFVTALTRLATVQDPQAIRGWLGAVLHNACLMRLRRHRPLLLGEPPDRVDPSTDPQQLVANRAVRDTIWSALNTLSDDERVTVMLRHFSRCASYQAIASVTGVPVGTVRSRLNRAHRRLGAALAAQGGTVPDQQRLESQRRADWEGFYRTVIQAPEPRTYRMLFDDDVQVSEWGIIWTGIRDWVALERPAIELGVRAAVVGVLAARDLTVLEIDFANPPEAPGHCPAHSTFVHRLHHGRTKRLAIHYTGINRQRVPEREPVTD